MQALEHFDPTMAVRYWLEKKQRKPRVPKKAKFQEWYKGVFDEATKPKIKPPKIKF